MNKKNNSLLKNMFPYLVLLVVVLATFVILNFKGKKVNELTTGELLTEIADNKVTEITIMPKSSESVYYVEGKLQDYKEKS